MRRFIIHFEGLCSFGTSAKAIRFNFERIFPVWHFAVISKAPIDFFRTYDPGAFCCKEEGFFEPFFFFFFNSYCIFFYPYTRIFGVEFKCTQIRPDPAITSIENILLTAINIFMRRIDTNFRPFRLFQKNRNLRGPSCPDL